MLTFAKLLALVAVCLVIILCDNGSAFTFSEDYHKEKRSTQNRTCFENGTADGYKALDKFDVEFLLIDENHIGRVRWKPPAAKRVPVDAFLILWTGYLHNSMPTVDCDFVSNETTSYDIKPSPLVWKYDGPLHIHIYPLPFKPEKNITMLTFIPHTYYTENHTSSAQNTTTTTCTEFDTNNKTRGGVENDGQEEYSVKLIFGSIVGVAMAIVLIIFLARSYTTKTSLSHKDTYYISQYAQRNNCMRELREFVDWLLNNQFDVQMLADEGSLLTEENRSLRRELPSFLFREHMIKTADKVFIIVSPSYLRLCKMREDDAMNENLSEEERLVNEEIIQIRSELYDHVYCSDRFIPILFCLEQATSIPFWVKELVFFSWPEEKTRLLNWLNGLPECPPNNLV